MRSIQSWISIKNKQQQIKKDKQLNKHALGGVSAVASFITTDEQLQ